MEVAKIEYLLYRCNSLHLRFRKNLQERWNLVGFDHEVRSTFDFGRWFYCAMIEVGCKLEVALEVPYFSTPPVEVNTSDDVYIIGDRFMCLPLHPSGGTPK